MDSQLRDQIPTFGKSVAGDRSVELTNLSALTSTLGGIRTWAEIGAILAECRVMVEACERAGVPLVIALCPDHGRNAGGGGPPPLRSLEVDLEISEDVLR